MWIVEKSHTHTKEEITFTFQKNYNYLIFHTFSRLNLLTSFILHQYAYNNLNRMFAIKKYPSITSFFFLNFCKNMLRLPASFSVASKRKKFSCFLNPFCSSVFLCTQFFFFVLLKAVNCYFLFYFVTFRSLFIMLCAMMVYLLFL